MDKGEPKNSAGLAKEKSKGAMAPFDGQVVSLDHGCGAHSEVAVARASPSTAADPVHDTVSDDLVAHGSVSPGEPAEELGHS